MKHKKEFDQNIINRVIMIVTDEDFDETKLNVSHRTVVMFSSTLTIYTKRILYL